MNEIEYNNLLNERRNLNIKIRLYKKQLNQQFLKDNHKKIRILNIFIIIMIIFNFGALLTTNALVMKNNKDKVFVEANPVTAKIYNFQTTPTAKINYFAFLFHITIWIIIITYFTIQKQNLLNQTDLTIFTIMILIYLTTLTLDFLNDFGYLLGKIIFT